MGRRELALAALVSSAAILARIPAITQPFVDAWAWRQSDVAMIARNFFEGHFRLFYPQVDWAGSTPGYVGTEFPLVPFLASLAYPVFGEHEWIGRAVSVAFFAVSLPFFYLLARATFNARSGVFALMFYAFAPLVIVSSRSFTSDMTACSLAIMAIYFFAQWLEDGRRASGARATLAMAAAMLVKVPYAIFGLPMLYRAFARYGWRLFRHLGMWLFAVTTVTLTGLWYLHAYLISVRYFPHHIFGHGMLQTMPWDVYRVILLRTFWWHDQYARFSALTPILSLMMLGGLLVKPASKFPWTFHWLLASSALFLFLAGKGNRFPAYQLSLVVVAAALGGHGLDALLAKLSRHGASWRAVGLVATAALVSFVAWSSVFVFPAYAPWAMPYLRAGRHLEMLLEPNELFVAATDLQPTLFYYSHRHGWFFDDVPGSFNPVRGENARDALETYRRLGAKYFAVPVFSRDVYEDPAFGAYLDSHFRRVVDDDDVVIFDVR